MRLLETHIPVAKNIQTWTKEQKKQATYREKLTATYSQKTQRQERQDRQNRLSQPAPGRCTTCNEGIHREARSFGHGYGKLKLANSSYSTAK